MGDRNKELAVIHCGKKELGLDDETYRAVLFSVARVYSAADLDHEGRRAVIQHMRDRGFKPKPKAARPRPKRAGRKPRVTQEKAPMMSKIDAILADLKLPTDYADGIADNMFGISKVEWLNYDQVRAVLQALMIHQKRVQGREQKHG